VHAWRIATDGPSAIRAWIDEQGRVVEMQHALGFSLRRTAYEIAFENWQQPRRSTRGVSRACASGSAART
jgi:hypothetical protein